MVHPPRIAIVEFHNLIRRGLVDLLSDDPSLSVVAVAEEPWRLDPAPTPYDVLLFGPSPPAEKDLAAGVAALAGLGRVLIVADPAGPRNVTDALAAGAHGCVSRNCGDEELLRAIATVAHGGLYLSPAPASRLRAELRGAAAPAQTLAPREIETLRWLAAGLTHGQIARRMDLTEATVSTYVKRIKNKLNVGTKAADLTRKAIELGLLRPQATETEPEAGTGTEPGTGSAA